MMRRTFSTRSYRAVLASLALVVLGLSACRGGSRASTLPDTGAASASATALPTSPVAATANTAPPPVVQRSAPKAPSRASSFACAAPKAGTKRYYERAYGNECAMRGGTLKVEDTPALKAAGHHPVTLCMDVDCTTDANCGPDRVCACGPTDGKTSEAHNRCNYGNCTSDTDCGGFACAESLAIGIPTQPAGVYGVIGHYCRSAADTCKADSECANVANGEKCLFTDGAFRCRTAR